MSDLDIYFEEERKEKVVIGERFKLKLSSREWLILGEGFILGTLALLLVFYGRKLIRGKKKK